MRRIGFVLLVVGVLSLGAERGLAQPQAATGPSGNTHVSSETPSAPCPTLRCTTAAQRRAAVARAAAARAAARPHAGNAKPRPAGSAGSPGIPDYFGIYPNYANSPLPTETNGAITGGVRKFVDSLAGVGLAGCDPASTCNANNLGNYIPVAIADQTTYAGSDYYQIGLFDYTWQFNSSLPTTTRVRGYRDLAAGADGKNHYLGPIIIAQRNRPVRVKFVNELGTGAAGKLFLPVDTLLMGAGMGPDGSTYTQNRAVLHLHGGNTPWISDGTPNEWITPAGESTTLQKGYSFQNVPDMAPGPSVESPSAGDGIGTYYWTNEQSGRMMWYHDHSLGMTRLNVYAGEVAGFILWDQNEEDLISGTNVSGINPGLKKILPDLGGAYHYGIPLIIQDKTFVPPPAQLASEDPTWDSTNWGGEGNLWFPHVYMPNQNPADSEGVNAMGRWDYGPWFWPPITTSSNPPLVHGPLPNPNYISPDVTPEEPPQMPGTPNPSLVPEAYMDTPLVNGTAYPYLTVSPKAYRFRILNGCNDRSLNLQLYYADPSNATEVKMVPAVPGAGLPPNWPTDGRDGGVPDPGTVGPPMIEIGTEGGFLPAPVVIPPTPIGYEYNRRSVTVLNVSTHSLLLGPAERADVIIDFSSVPTGSTLILYNDSPAPIPGLDSRNDYYTGDPDQTSTGGAPTTLPGYGPNTRTIMQFRVSGTAAGPFDINSLNALLPAAYAASQPPPVIPEAAYGTGYGATFTDNYVKLPDNSVVFSPPAGSTLPVFTPPAGSPLPPGSCTDGTCTFPTVPKAIQELFELNYGRMNATLGVELPFTNANTQTTIPLGYIDPLTEIINNGDTQFWKITHNGVDTHFIHFHLFNVQLINRIGWDGTVKPPDPNELGWKDTVRMNPLEITVVALKPLIPSVPFEVPLSTRPPDVTQPANATIQVTDPVTGVVTTEVNDPATNFGWEYVWHCHVLGHEENDMMRPIAMMLPPEEDSGSPAVLTNPWPGTMLGSAATFAWGSAIGEISGYQLLVGTTGPGSSDIFTGGSTSTPLPPTTLSQSVSGLPSGGVTVYVRLVTQIEGTWQSPNDYTYVAAKTATSTGMVSSLNPSLAGQSVTLTATVTPAPTGAQSGTVQFQEGGVVIGTAAVTNGTATLMTSGLAPGPHDIVADYSGNAAFAASASGMLAQQVNNAFPDFSLSSSPASGSGTVRVGATLPITVTVTPIDGYNGTVTLSCDTIVAGLTCDVLPGSVIPSGQAVTATLTVSVPSSSALASPPVGPGLRTRPSVALATLISFGLTLGALFMSGRKTARSALIALSVLTWITVAGLAGCGGSSATLPTPGPSPLVGPQSVILYANGTGPSTVSHQMTINFTVQQ